MEEQEARPGQIWVEKSKRQEYNAPRRLRVLRVGEKEMSRQPGDPVEITPIYYAISYGIVLKPSKRTLSMFTLRKVWRLEKDAPGFAQEVVDTIRRDEAKEDLEDATEDFLRAVD